MKTFESEIEQVGDITFPEPAGTRIMMMPFHRGIKPVGPIHSPRPEKFMQGKNN